jgi:hypothetical protein
MRVRYPAPPRNAGALPLFAWADGRAAQPEIGARARWLVRRFHMSRQRAELVASLCFGVGRDR